MNENLTIQNIYDKLMGELEFLNNNLKILDINRQKCSKETSEALFKMNEDEQKVRNLEYQQNKLCSKYDVISVLLVLVLFIVLEASLVVGSPVLVFQILTKIVKVSSGVPSILGLLSMIGSSVLGFVLWYRSIEKIVNICKKISKGMSMNSKKYEMILEKVNTAKMELELSKSNYEKSKENSKKVHDQYLEYQKVRDEKRNFLEYIDKEMNPVETTLSLKKELKPNKKNIDRKVFRSIIAE